MGAGGWRLECGGWSVEAGGSPLEARGWSSSFHPLSVPRFGRSSPFHSFFPVSGRAPRFTRFPFPISGGALRFTAVFSVLGRAPQRSPDAAQTQPSRSLVVA